MDGALHRFLVEMCRSAAISLFRLSRKDGRKQFVARPKFVGYIAACTIESMVWPLGTGADAHIDVARSENGRISAVLLVLGL